MIDYKGIIVEEQKLSIYIIKFHGKLVTCYSLLKLKRIFSNNNFITEQMGHTFLLEAPHLSLPQHVCQ